MPSGSASRRRGGRPDATTAETVVRAAHDFNQNFNLKPGDSKKQHADVWTKRAAIVQLRKGAWLAAVDVAKDATKKDGSPYSVIFAEDSETKVRSASLTMDVLQDEKARTGALAEIIQGFIGGKFTDETGLHAVPDRLFRANGVASSGQPLEHVDADRDDTATEDVDIASVMRASQNQNSVVIF